MSFSHLKLVRDFLDDAAGHWSNLLGEAADERVLAENVHRSRQSAGHFMNHYHRLLRENVLRRPSRDSQPPGDVRRGLPSVEPLELAPQRDALPQRVERRIPQAVQQLRLPGQDDVQELRRGGLDVAQQADLLEQFRRHALGFVNDQTRRLSPVQSRLEKTLQLFEEPRLGGSSLVAEAESRATSTHRTLSG